ncbi:MAG: bacillithiol biosynthesis deacetylase BshB1 [Flavobacteriales bacterium]|nr:MAG: bacillithiol biosynthesis deacetylase BshB1 [Flavobacteriales bacterium]
MSEVDILCITAHPDDVELCMGGTVLHHVALGKRVGLVELTVGELGTRGNGALRKEEAEAARKVLGADFRYQLDLADGFFRADRESLLKVVQVIRRHKPSVIFTNTLKDRHPDHGRSAALVTEACFLSGLRRVETSDDGNSQEAWRPTTVLHTIQDWWMEPTLVVDVTPYWEKRMAAMFAFKSQFFDPTSSEPVSSISGQDFPAFVEGRALQIGRLIGVKYGEGFVASRAFGVDDVTLLK